MSKYSGGNVNGLKKKHVDTTLGRKYANCNYKTALKTTRLCWTSGQNVSLWILTVSVASGPLQAHTSFLKSLRE